MSVYRRTLKSVAHYNYNYRRNRNLKQCSRKPKQLSVLKQYKYDLFMCKKGHPQLLYHCESECFNGLINIANIIESLSSEKERYNRRFDIDNANTIGGRFKTYRDIRRRKLYE